MKKDKFLLSSVKFQSYTLRRSENFTLTKCIINANIPPGVINIIHGAGKEAGEPLINHSDIAAISFTGSSNTGAKIGSIAAQSFKKVSLECGGKNASIVFADCDFENTVDGVCRYVIILILVILD